MRRLTCVLMCLMLMLPGLARGDAAVDVVYYYFNPCGACNEGQEFSAAFYERVVDAGLSGRFRIITCNAYTDKAGLDKALEALGLDASPGLPMLVMGDRYLAGREALESGMIDWLQGEPVESEAAPAPAATAAVPATSAEGGGLVYLYAPGCRSCAQMKAVLAELDIEVREINIYDAPDEADALFERYGVPEAERLVPMVFMGERYVADPDEAAVCLPEWIGGSAVRE